MTNRDRIDLNHDAKVRMLRTGTVLSGLVLVAGVALRAVLRKPQRPSFERRIEKGVQAMRDAVAPVVKRIGGQFSALRARVEERVKQV